MPAHPPCHPEDLRNHTLLHAATLTGVWPRWLRAADVPDLVPRHAVTLEHFYLTLQAALDGLGWRWDRRGSSRTIWRPDA